MLIVHLITGLQFGGAERQLAQLVLNSDKHRFCHVVVSLRKGAAVGCELKRAGIEVSSLGMKRGVPSMSGMIRLIRLLRRLKPDVLHCWLYHACLMGAVCGRLAGTTSVIWGLRSANPGLREYSRRTRAVVRLCGWFSHSADRIIVNSEKNRMVHLELGYEPAKMQLIQNGVDTQRHCPNPYARKAVREELGVASDAFLVGMFAAYRPTKDHATFLHAARLLRGKYKDVCFLLAGEEVSSDNRELVDVLRRNELEQVTHLLGPRDDCERLAAALDIACLSSWSESFPNAIAEAMACGVPCVATDVGDTAHIIGDTGIVVPSQSPQTLAEACFQLIQMGAKGRQELGSRARKRIEEHFTAAKSMRAYENLYEGMREVVRFQRARPVAI